MLDRTRFQWPPDYVGQLMWRQEQLRRMRKNPSMIKGARLYYKNNHADFIEDWLDTYDPRNAGTIGKTVRMPFLLFPRQREFVEFLHALVRSQTNGLVEKSRDMGATWTAGGFSVAEFLFNDGCSYGWGSRKEMLVDSTGNMDSIFEKLRYMINCVPSEFYPKGFDPDKNMPHMKIVAEGTESSITGESGDDIGRGGRKLAYFKDESAHYERPEKIEASLGDNTKCQIDISSVHGLGNVFHRKRDTGIDWYPGEPLMRTRANVFVMDWRDHPDKDLVWYREREQAAREAGLLHIFRQEVDRDYSASIEGTIVPADWVKSAIDAHKKIEGMDAGPWMAGLDVADEGADRNAFVRRKGCVLTFAEEWGDRDVGETARRAAMLAQQTRPISVQYDCIGVGAGVKAETNRLIEVGQMPRNVRFVAWDAGSGPLYPDERVIIKPDGTPDIESPLNKDFYANLKAQGWWMLRRRFERTHNWITKGTRCKVDELISIDSTIPKLRSLEKEISQPVSKKSLARMKLVVDKTPTGSKSPNMGDATMQCYWPCENKNAYDSTMSWVG